LTGAAVARYSRVMTKPAPRDKDNKFARYRNRKRAQGLKLVRLWVPDPEAPGFQEEIDRQLALLKDALEQKEILDFFEAIESEDHSPE
jgi:hypothetical protein